MRKSARVLVPVAACAASLFIPSAFAELAPAATVLSPGVTVQAASASALVPGGSGAAMMSGLGAAAGQAVGVGVLAGAVMAVNGGPGSDHHWPRQTRRHRWWRPRH